jgi:hypothetical protein
VLVPYLFFAFGTGFLLGHYMEAWMPPLALLIGLELVALSKRGLPGWAAAACLLALFAGPSSTLVERVAGAHPNGYALVAQVLRERGRAGVIIVRGHPNVLHAYLPRARLLRDTLTRLRVDAVVLDPEIASRAKTPSRYLALHRAGLTPLRVGKMTVWLRTGR